jgi:hypothetical protein
VLNWSRNSPSTRETTVSSDTSPMFFSFCDTPRECARRVRARASPLRRAAAALPGSFRFGAARSAGVSPAWSSKQAGRLRYAAGESREKFAGCRMKTKDHARASASVRNAAAGSARTARSTLHAPRSATGRHSLPLSRARARGFARAARSGLPRSHARRARTRRTPATHGFCRGRAAPDHQARTRVLFRLTRGAGSRS